MGLVPLLYTDSHSSFFLVFTFIHNKSTTNHFHINVRFIQAQVGGRQDSCGRSWSHHGPLCLLGTGNTQLLVSKRSTRKCLKAACRLPDWLSGTLISRGKEENRPLLGFAEPTCSSDVCCELFPESGTLHLKTGPCLF